MYIIRGFSSMFLTEFSSIALANEISLTELSFSLAQCLERALKCFRL